MIRSCYCAEVGEKQIGQKIELAGWVQARRDHGGVLFIDLRDRSGIVQIVFNPEPAALFKLAEELRPEFVIHVKGAVRARPEGTKNPNLATGLVEVVVGGEGVGEVVVAHDDEGGAVGEGPVLVGAVGVEVEGGVEESGVGGQYMNVGLDV